jgi:hypothetical protein
VALERQGRVSGPEFALQPGLKEGVRLSRKAKEKNALKLSPEIRGTMNWTLIASKNGPSIAGADELEQTQRVGCKGKVRGWRVGE